MAAPIILESPCGAGRAAVRRSVVSRVIRHRPDALLYALAAMSITYVWRLPRIFPFLEPLRLGIVTGLLALLLFVAKPNLRGRLSDVPSAPFRLALALLGAMVLATPAGLYPTNSALYLLQTVLPSLLLMIMLASAVRSTADVEWFAAVNLAAAMGYGVFVLWVFRVGRDGRLAELIYYDGNDLGLLLVATLPFVVYFMSRAQSRGRRALATGAAPLFLLLLVRTGSRGAFLGLLVVLAYLALTYRGMPRRMRLGGVAVVVTGFVVVGGGAYASKIGTLLNPTEDYNWQGNSPTGRIEIWKRGLGYVLDRPLLGVGVNNFMRAEGNLSDLGRDRGSRGEAFKWSVAHNSYLETAVESGMLGFVAFIGLFIATFRALARVVRATRPLPFLSRELVLAQVLTASLAGYLVCAFFVSAEYFSYLYVLVGLAIGLGKVAFTRAGTRA